MELHRFQMSFLVERFGEEFMIDQFLLFRFDGVFDRAGFDGLRSVAFAADDQRQKFAGLVPDRDHAVRMRGVIHDAVARFHDLDLIIQLDFQAAFEDVVEFLPGMGGQMDRGVFILRGRLDHEGFRLAVFEQRGAVQIFESRAAADRHPAVVPGERVEGQFRGFARDQLAEVDSEPFGTAVDEGEGTVRGPGFMRQILFFGGFGDPCHFRNGDCQDRPEFTQTISHLGELIVHDFYPVMKFSLLDW